MKLKCCDSNRSGVLDRGTGECNVCGPTCDKCGLPETGLPWYETCTCKSARQEDNDPPPVPPKHSHYFKDVKHLDTIDVYRVLQLFGVTDQAVGHAVKKLLCSGKRGAKDEAKDLREAIDSINRALEIRAEDISR